MAFDDIMAQMVDMIHPGDPFFFTARDLKKNRQLAGVLFNIMFNLTKFVSFEIRDPFSTKQHREEYLAGISEWERFAKDEYCRLALEDDMEEDDSYQTLDDATF